MQSRIRSALVLGLMGAWVVACNNKPEYIDTRLQWAQVPWKEVGELGRDYKRPDCSKDKLPGLPLVDAPTLMQATPALKEFQAKLPAGVTMALGASSSSGEGRTHVDLSFAVEGINLCQFHGRFHSEPTGSFARGAIPQNLPKAPVLSQLDWREFAPIWLKEADRRLNKGGKASNDVVHYRSEKCLYVDNDQTYKPAWQLDFYRGIHPYRALVVGGVLREVKPLFFGLTAHSQIWDHNVASQKIIDVTLPNLESNGYLCGKDFTTRVPISRRLAYSELLTFTFPPDDPRFGEVSAFTNAQLMWNWFREHGVENWFGVPIEIVITYDDDSMSGGPTYVPGTTGTGSRPARIYLPDHTNDVDSDGNIVGKKLQNLDTDSEAISHEVGHHVVSQYVGITALNPDHFLIHEALADLFVIARMKNPCMCETICTAKADVCVPNRTCLRTADNKITYGSQEYLQLDGFHKQAQVLIGLFWDLNKQQGIDFSDLVKLVLGALPHLNRETDLDNFFAALFEAEAGVEKDKNKCKIYEAAMKRGYKKFLEKVTGCS